MPEAVATQIIRVPCSMRLTLARGLSDCQLFKHQNLREAHLGHRKLNRLYSFKITMDEWFAPKILASLSQATTNERTRMEYIPTELVWSFFIYRSFKISFIRIDISSIHIEFWLVFRASTWHSG